MRRVDKGKGEAPAPKTFGELLAEDPNAGSVWNVLESNLANIISPLDYESLRSTSRLFRNNLSATDNANTGENTPFLIYQKLKAIHTRRSKELAKFQQQLSSHRKTLMRLFTFGDIVNPMQNTNALGITSTLIQAGTCIGLFAFAMTNATDSEGDDITTSDAVKNIVIPLSSALLTPFLRALTHMTGVAIKDKSVSRLFNEIQTYERSFVAELNNIRDQFGMPALELGCHHPLRNQIDLTDNSIHEKMISIQYPDRCCRNSLRDSRHFNTAIQYVAAMQNSLQELKEIADKIGRYSASDWQKLKAVQAGDYELRPEDQWITEDAMGIDMEQILALEKFARPEHVIIEMNKADAAKPYDENTPLLGAR